MKGVSGSAIGGVLVNGRDSLSRILVVVGIGNGVRMKVTRSSAIGGGIGAWEKFGVKHLNGNRFYLRGGRYNKWCRYTKGNVKCDRPRWNWGTQFRYKRL